MDKLDYMCLRDKIKSYDLSYLFAIKRYIKNNIKFLKFQFKEYKKSIDFKICDSITYNKFLDCRCDFSNKFRLLKEDFKFIDSCIFNFTNVADIRAFYTDRLTISVSYDFVNNFFTRYSFFRVIRVAVEV